ncbi:MAG: arginine--tRNA ligase [Gammaproteobacteria bacterium]|nr:arginine--tRNA ligase [Gammaproteobacteria bacterium]MYD76552.1 arginine--tRNA ligase [Gammaproteobacteria bacterium]MYJ52486.1 arginine--tRNA ligase [Gammaproteobacteria bacterium]
MKDQVRQLVADAIARLKQQGDFVEVDPEQIVVERTRDASHGDFTTNIAMKLASRQGCPARELAGRIVEAMPGSAILERAEVAGPGFINLFVDSGAYIGMIDTIRSAGSEYGKSDSGSGLRVLVEFVSSNPTGPLHVGHGRGAAYGDALVRILSFAGYDAHAEYYVNDAGRQMDILTVSVWIRYLEALGLPSRFPENGYRGGYIRNIARQLNESYGSRFARDDPALFEALPGDTDAGVDELVRRCKEALGEGYETVFNAACGAMVDDIRKDLGEFGVVFDRWFHESSLVGSGDIDASLARLDENGYLYEQDGATWFRSTDFGDDKDRVVVRANGSKTYFASDIAYHYNKAERQYDRIINVFGADHHGYTKRIEASFQAMGNPPERLEFLVVQFAILYRGDEKVSMSTREGEFVPLRELREEAGNDAARFFYVLRRSDQHMEFDLELAKSQSAENPVYYIQYAHARICSVFEQAREKGLGTPNTQAPDYRLLTEEREMELLKVLARFPETVKLAAANRAPHQVAYYLRDLAHLFHAYYNAHPFLSSRDELRLARLGLIDAVRVVIANGLGILGVSAPSSM